MRWCVEEWSKKNGIFENGVLRREEEAGIYRRMERKKKTKKEIKKEKEKKWNMSGR